MVLGDNDQTIISNYDEDNPTLAFRKISASNKEIRIWGAKTKSSYVSIAHKTKETDWTTVFVEWSNKQGSFLANGNVGTFTCQEPLKALEETAIYIGGRFGGCRLFNGAISTLEIYVDAESRLPDGLKNLIISRQLIERTTDEENIEL